MATDNQTTVDEAVRLIRETLVQGYGVRHPKAQIDVRRRNSACIRIRIIDPDFKRKSRDRRVNTVWRALQPLPDETVTQVSMMFLFTPEEAENSVMNYEFEHPSPLPD